MIKAQFYKSLADQAVLNDARTIMDPHAPLIQKGLAALTFIPAEKLFGLGAKGIRFISKPIVRVSGKSEEVLNTLRKAGVNEKQVKKFKEFIKRNNESTVHNLPNEGKFFQRVEPGEKPGRFAIYQKAVDKNGDTIFAGKLSSDDKGQFLHANTKQPFDSPYIYNIKDYWHLVEEAIRKGLKR